MNWFKRLFKRGGRVRPENISPPPPISPVNQCVVNAILNDLKSNKWYSYKSNRYSPSWQGVSLKCDNKDYVIDCSLYGYDQPKCDYFYIRKDKGPELDIRFTNEEQKLIKSELSKYINEAINLRKMQNIKEFFPDCI